MTPCQSAKCKKTIGGWCISCKFDFKDFENKRLVQVDYWQKVLDFIAINPDASATMLHETFNHKKPK